MLFAKNISKTYSSGRKIALQDFNISVPTGSIYGLLGPNGAGKTTFIRIINQIIQPDGGEIQIDGKPLQPAHIRDIGYMPEERGLYKNMTVGDQLIYFGELKGMSRAEALQQAKMWFERLEIDQWWKKKLSELSKGMAQKIQFVVTVLHRPKLLILDEPFSGFDPVNANLVRDQILRLKNEGTTIILSTHRMESVEQMCDSVALLNHGRKVIDGSVFEVREQFKTHEYTVVLQNPDAESLQNFVQKYQINNLTAHQGLSQFSFKKDHLPQPEILQLLSGMGTIRLFEEKIPSMNEVFVNAVQQSPKTN